MRTPIIAGNWKMYKTVADAVKYVKEFRVAGEGHRRRRDRGGAAVHRAPRRRRSRAQQQRRSSRRRNDWEREGAFTGEVSGADDSRGGREYVIIGHSERRTLFGETDATVNRKTRAAFAAGLTPIVCIGETLDQRDATRRWRCWTGRSTRGSTG